MRIQDHTEEQSYREWQQLLMDDPGYIEYMASITTRNLKEYYESQRHVPVSLFEKRGLPSTYGFDDQAGFDGERSEG
jgi:hypothetical protein